MNLLKCSLCADEMQPGDELMITLEDADVKDNLILILRAMDEIEFEVFNAGRCYQIIATKKEFKLSGKGGGFTGGN